LYSFRFFKGPISQTTQFKVDKLLLKDYGLTLKEEIRKVLV